MAGILIQGTRRLDLDLPDAPRIAGLLHDQGLRAGAVVGIAVSADIEAARLVLGCLAARVVVLPLDPGARPSEAWALLEKAGASLLFADPGLGESWGLRSIPVLTVRPPQPQRLWSRWLGRAETPDASSFPACLDAAPALDLSAPLPSDPALLLGTSGTTGLARLVVLTHGNLRLQLSAIGARIGLAGGRMLNPLPWSHYDGLVGGLLLAAAAGAALVREERFEVARVGALLDAVYRERITHLVATPTMLQLLVRLGGDLKKVFDPSYFRMVLSTAAPLPEDLWSRFEAAAGCRVVNVYGLTETGNLCFAGPDDQNHRIGTVGTPCYGCLRVVDREGQPVPGGSPGELHVSGPELSPGYWGEPAREGWFATGDEVIHEPSGHLRVVGRIKQAIVSGGFTVWPAEVDAALRAHPAVREVATFGLPDPLWGERIISAVVLDGPATEAELMATARERLSEHKRPREIWIREALPTGALGKVRPDALVAGGSVEETVLRLAAAAFQVPVDTLSLATTPARCPGWDSMAHLDLVQRLERCFGLVLTPREILGLRCLHDAVALVEARR